MLNFGWLKGSADHVSNELEKDSASRSAGKLKRDLIRNNDSKVSNS